MLYALVNGSKELASPQAKGLCPGCSGRLIARCGDLNIWHWAHASANCDTNKEGETAWHLDRKSWFPREMVEKKVGCNRADVKTKRCVIEFQHSSMPVETLRWREAGYYKMVWVVDGTTLGARWHHRKRGSHFVFQWDWPKRWVKHSKMPVYIDLGSTLFLINRWTSTSTGRGRPLSRDEFIRAMLIEPPPRTREDFFKAKAAQADMITDCIYQSVDPEVWRQHHDPLWPEHVLGAQFKHRESFDEADFEEIDFRHGPSEWMPDDDGDDPDDPDDWDDDPVDDHGNDDNPNSRNAPLNI